MKKILTFICALVIVLCFTQCDYNYHRMYVEIDYELINGQDTSKTYTIKDTVYQHARKDLKYMAKPHVVKEGDLYYIVVGDYAITSSTLPINLHKIYRYRILPDQTVTYKEKKSIGL